MASSPFFPSLFTSTIRGRFLTLNNVKLHCKCLHACAMHPFPSCHIHIHINTQTVSIIRRKVSLRHLIISCATNQTKRKTRTNPTTNSPENFLQRCLRRSGASLGPKSVTLSHSHSPGVSYGWDCGFIRSGSMDDEITNLWLISQFWQWARNCTIFFEITQGKVDCSPKHENAVIISSHLILYAVSNVFCPYTASHT